MSSLLVGTQVAFTGKIVTLANETAVAVPVTGGAGGILSALDFRTGSNASTALSLKAALVKAVEGKPPSGAPTVVASAKIPLTGSTAANKWLSEVASWESFVQNEPIVVSAAYFWIVVPLGGNICLRYEKTEGGTHVWKHTTANVTEATATISWVENAETPGPLDMAGLGEPSPQISGTAAATGAGSGAIHAPTGVVFTSAAATAAAEGAVKGGPEGPAILKGVTAAQASAASTASIFAPTAIPFTAAAATAATEGLVGVGGGHEVAYGGLPKQWSDIWVGAAPNAPIVMWVAGGGWVNDQVALQRANAEGFWHLTGANVYNVNYRNATSSVGSFPAAIEDLESAINYAIAHAVANNGNPRRIYLVAGSAGAHLASMAALRMNAAKQATVRGVACLSGIFDLKRMVEEMEKGELREEPWGSVTDGVLTNSGGTGFIESATANFTSAMLGYIVKSVGKVPSKSYVKAIISSTKIELSLENTLTGSGVTFALQHPGGSENNLTEHIEEALQQNLVYVGPYTGEPGVTPPNPGNPASNLTASREAQEASSPVTQTVVKGCRWYLFSAIYDLIPGNQWEAFKAHLEAAGVPVKVGLVEGIFNPGHAFSFYAERIGGKLIKELLANWIAEAEAVYMPMTPAAAQASATGVIFAPGVTFIPFSAAAALSAASGEVSSDSIPFIPFSPAAGLASAAGGPNAPTRVAFTLAGAQAGAGGALAASALVVCSGANATAAGLELVMGARGPGFIRGSSSATASATGHVETPAFETVFPTAVPLAGSVSGVPPGRSWPT